MSRLQNLLQQCEQLGFHPESAWWLLLLPLCLLAWLPRWRRRASIVHASTETFAGTGGSCSAGAVAGRGARQRKVPLGALA